VTGRPDWKISLMVRAARLSISGVDGCVAMGAFSFEAIPIMNNRRIRAAESREALGRRMIQNLLARPVPVQHLALALRTGGHDGGY